MVQDGQGQTKGRRDCGNADERGRVGKGKGRRYSQTLSTNRGSFHTLNVWLRCGCKPAMVVWGRARLCRPRADRQRVAWTGVVRNVRSISNLIVIDRWRSAKARFVKQTLTAILKKSAMSLAECVFVEAQLGSHIVARQAVPHIV